MSSTTPPKLNLEPEFEPVPHTEEVAMPTDPPTPTDSLQGDDNPSRGRLKRRRLPSHTPPRASSPSRGHDRSSGSRHRHHYRKHHRASSSSSSPFVEAPPTAIAKKNRRRSDAEPDHTFRGRVRNRSESRSRSPILEGGEEREGCVREVRKRSQPPSRGRDGVGAEDMENAVRRLRSYPNMYRQGKGATKEVEGGRQAAV